MSISYSSEVGIGVLEETISFDSLTEYGLSILVEWFDDSDWCLELCNEYREEEEDDEDVVLPKDVYATALRDYFNLVTNEDDFLCEGLGLDSITGNLYSGYVQYRGVSIDLNIDTFVEDVLEAKLKFEKVLDIEPKLYNGVLVY